MSSSPLRLSLVLPTVDRPQALYNLLRHLEHQTQPPHEIIIVDQSTDADIRVRDYAASRASVRYHRILERGLPNARNVGVRLSTGDVVLFLDDDSIPDPELVRVHVEDYGSPSVGGVGGRVKGGYDASAGATGTFDAGAGTVTRNFGAGARCEVDHLPGGNMSFRREVFDRIGGFDRTFGGNAIGEETDFCLRARRAGFALVFDPRASLEHLHLPTGGCRSPRFEDWLYWHAHNSMLFLLRHARLSAVPLFVLKRVVRTALFAIEEGSVALLPVGLKGMLRGVTAHLSRRAAP